MFKFLEQCEPYSKNVKLAIVIVSKGGKIYSHLLHTLRLKKMFFHKKYVLTKSSHN